LYLVAAGEERTKMRFTQQGRTVAIGLGVLALAAMPVLGAGHGVTKFGELSYSRTEGTIVQVVVERSQGEDGAASVRVISSGGSATAGSDYAAVDMTLSWANGDGSSRIVSVPLTDDASAESSETIQLSLVDGTGAMGSGTKTLDWVRRITF